MRPRVGVCVCGDEGLERWKEKEADEEGQAQAQARGEGGAFVALD